MIFKRRPLLFKPICSYNKIIVCVLLMGIVLFSPVVVMGSLKKEVKYVAFLKDISLTDASLQELRNCFKSNFIDALSDELNDKKNKNSYSFELIEESQKSVSSDYYRQFGPAEKVFCKIEIALSTERPKFVVRFKLHQLLADNSSKPLVSGRISFSDNMTKEEIVKGTARFFVQRVNGFNDSQTFKVNLIDKRNGLSIEQIDATISVLSDTFHDSGKAPISFDLTKGKYAIYVEVSPDSIYQSKFMNIHIDGSKKNPINIELDRKKGIVSFSPEFKGGLIFLNDRKYSYSDLKHQIDIGENHLYAVSKDRLVYHKKIIIAPNTEYTIKTGLPIHGENTKDIIFTGPPLNNTFQKSPVPLIRKKKEGNITGLKIYGNKIFLVDKQNRLHVKDVIDDTKKWTFFDGRISKGPFFLAGRMFIICYAKTLNFWGKKKDAHILIELNINTGEVLWSSPYIFSSSALGLQSDDAVVFIFEGNKVLYFVNASEKSRKSRKIKIKKMEQKYGFLNFIKQGEKLGLINDEIIGLDPEHSYIKRFSLSEKTFKYFTNNRKYKFLKIFSDCIVGYTVEGGIEFLEPTTGKILSFSQRDNKAAIPQYTSRIKIEEEDIFDIATNNNHLYIISKNWKLWDADLNSKSIIVRILMKETSNNSMSINNASYMTGFVIDRYANFLITENSHNLMYFNPKINSVIWETSLDAPISLYSLGEKSFTLITKKDDLYTFGYAAPPARIKGWVTDIGSSVTFNIAETATENEKLVATSLKKLVEANESKCLTELNYFNSEQLKGNSSNDLVKFSNSSLNVGDVVIAAPKKTIRAHFPLQEGDNPGCSVILNGFFYGYCPVSILNLKRGEHNLLLCSPKHVSRARKFNVPLEEKLENVKLVPNPKYIFTLTAKPSTAAIYKNGEFQATGKSEMRNLDWYEIIVLEVKDKYCYPLKKRIRINRNGVCYGVKLFPKFMSDSFSLSIKTLNPSAIVGWQYMLEPGECNATPLRFAKRYAFPSIGYSCLYGEDFNNSPFLRRLYLRFLGYKSFFPRKVVSANHELTEFSQWGVGFGMGYFAFRLPILGHTGLGYSILLDRISTKWIDSNEEIFTSQYTKYYMMFDIVFTPSDQVYIIGQYSISGLSDFEFNDRSAIKKSQSFQRFTISGSYSKRKWPFVLKFKYDYENNLMSYFKDYNHSFSIEIGLKGILHW